MNDRMGTSGWFNFDKNMKNIIQNKSFPLIVCCFVVHIPRWPAIRIENRGKFRCYLLFPWDRVKKLSSTIEFRWNCPRGYDKYNVTVTLNSPITLSKPISNRRISVSRVPPVPSSIMKNHWPLFNYLWVHYWFPWSKFQTSHCLPSKVDELINSNRMYKKEEGKSSSYVNDVSQIHYNLVGFESRQNGLSRLISFLHINILNFPSLPEMGFHLNVPRRWRIYISIFSFFLIPINVKCFIDQWWKLWA